MVEERNENLQPADGMNEEAEIQINSDENKPQKIEEAKELESDSSETVVQDAVSPEQVEQEDSVEKEAKVDKKETSISENTEEVYVDKKEAPISANIKEDSIDKEETLVSEHAEDKSVDDVVEEIEKNVASESENNDVAEHSIKEHNHIPMLSYKDFDLKTLLEEAEKLLSTYPVQKIKKHLEEIKVVFDEKVALLIHEKKEENPDEEVNISEYHNFKRFWKDYKHKLHLHYKENQDRLDNNLAKREELIEDLKHIIDSTEYDFDERIKKFKEIQRSWRNAGSVPSTKYSNIWQTFKHHEERFYDLLDLDRDYRDKVFEENLEEKKKIIAKANDLLKENDIHFIFKQLQDLHKQWKEETGPVARDNREEVWGDFKEVTKKIHDKRREFYKKLKEEFGANLVKKRALIETLKELTAEVPATHKQWQGLIKKIEAVRESFYQIGYVPKKHREKVWGDFKSTIKGINKHKNNYYKSLKELQKENLDKKMELIRIAEELKDTEEWDTATKTYKEIQEKWKQIGHVPRKSSDKIWNQFRAACNHYFDRFHKHVKGERGDELEIFLNKKAFLQQLKDKFENVSDDASYTIDDIKKITEEWNAIGYVSADKRFINAKFNKYVNSLYDKLNIDKRELSFLKFKNTVDEYMSEENYRKIDSEKRYVRQKIDAIFKEIQQLENNLMFVKSADKNNPFKREVQNNIAKNLEILAFWKKKQQYLDNLKY